MARSDVDMRLGRYKRTSSETDIEVGVNLDGYGRLQGSCGIGFVDHMLHAFAAHSMVDIEVTARGDLHVDQHHLVEDLGMCLGLALKKALGDRSGLCRFGWALVPMDEALVYCALDVGGRPFCAVDLPLKNAMCGQFQADLVEDFFQALATGCLITLHLKALAARSPHHVVEATFKAFAIAFRQAVSLDPRRSGIPSTKGIIDMA